MNRLRRTILFVFVAGLLAAAAFLGRSATPVFGYQVAPPHAGEQLIVKLAPGVSLDMVNTTYGTRTLRALLNSQSIYLLQAPAAPGAVELARQMSEDADLLYAELNYLGAAPEAFGVDSIAWPDGGAEANGVDSIAWPEGDSGADGVDSIAWPTDGSPIKSVEASYYLWEPDPGDEARYTYQPAAHALGLADAHRYHRGAGVTVAILDTGIDLAHGALRPYLAQTRYDFVDDDDYPQDSRNGRDDDGDGYVDEVAGHGTHIAGIVHLVAPEATLMPLRVLDSDGQGDSFVIAEAMMYAAEHGADVINLSLGSAVRSHFMEDVLAQITGQGVVVVAASGNLAASFAQYPAASSCALAVTAVNHGAQHEPYANYGAWIDFSAPGARIYSTFAGGEYAWWSGTSMSAPFVAGQAALLRAYDRALSPQAIAGIIAATAQETDSTNGDLAGLMGAGRVDVGASLAFVAAGGQVDAAGSPLAACTP